MRLLLATLLAACASSPDYGAPDAATSIAVDESGGLVGPGGNHTGVHLEGTLATYVSGAMTETAMLTTDQVAAMIHALEDVGFLGLHSSTEVCAADAPTVAIDAAVAAGTNHVEHSLGCDASLDHLDQQLFDISGLSAWLASR